MEKLLDGMSHISREAGKAILEIYKGEDLGIEIKADDSPLTAADLAANEIIVAGLQALAPDIPILSEESNEIDFSTRQSWSRYFLVDPLDGTKEFINRNGEFTVNIALIEKNVAILGVIYVPVQDVLYAGFVDAKDQGGDSRAYVERDGSRSEIQTRKIEGKSMTIVASRRHGSETMEECMALLTKNFNVETKNVGSSLKFCMIAEGKADLYPRLAPTSEWDTAAAQAIVEAAGGRVLDADFNPLRYNTKDSILNPHFYVLADTDFDWQTVLTS